MKVIEITEDCFGDAMQLARKAKEALCGIEEALTKGSMEFRGGSRGYGHPHYRMPDIMDYRDFEKHHDYPEYYPEYRRGMGR